MLRIYQHVFVMQQTGTVTVQLNICGDTPGIITCTGHITENRIGIIPLCIIKYTTNRFTSIEAGMQGVFDIGTGEREDAEIDIMIGSSNQLRQLSRSTVRGGEIDLNHTAIDSY